MCVCLCVTKSKMMHKKEGFPKLGYHSMEVPTRNDIGHGEPLFGIFIGVRPAKLAVAKYLYWTDSTPRIVLLLDPTPFSIALYCYWTNFLLHSSVNLSISDDDHHHSHHIDDDDGDDDYSIHPKALFPAPRAAGRNHHLSDFCQNVSASSSSSSYFCRNISLQHHRHTTMISVFVFVFVFVFVSVFVFVFEFRFLDADAPTGTGALRAEDRPRVDLCRLTDRHI